MADAGHRQQRKHVRNVFVVDNHNASLANDDAVARIDTIFLAISHLDQKIRAFTGCCFKDVACHLQNDVRKAEALQMG
jgi:hypothetical protein